MDFSLLNMETKHFRPVYSLLKESGIAIELTISLCRLRS